MKRGLVCALALGAAAGCGASAPPVMPTSRVDARPIPLPRGSSAASTDDAPPSVPSHLVAQIAGQKSIGPFLARRAGGALVAYMDGDKTARRLTTVALGANGVPKGEPRIVLEVPVEPTALIVRAGGQAAEYYAAWSALLDRGESVSIVGLTAAGVAKGGTTEIARTNDHVRWLDVLPAAQGAVCVWAEQTNDKDVSIFAAAVDDAGKARGLPTRVAMGVRGFQVVAMDDGVGVATVARDDARGTSQLSWRRVDYEGRLVGDAVTVASAPTTMADIDATRAAGGVVFAWTDRSGEDPEISLAAVDDARKVVVARHALTSFGGAELVKLVTGRAGTALAWEEPRPRPHGARRAHLAKVALTPTLSADDASAFEFWPYPDGQGPSVPEIVAADDGFGALFSAQACTAAAPLSPRDPPCSTASTVVPTYLRFDEKLAPAGAQPFRLGDEHDIATIGWSLDCSAGACLALAALSAHPIPVRVVDLAARPSAYLAPVVPPLPPNAPRVVALQTLATGEPYADVDAEKIGDGTLVATLTEAVDIDANGQERSSGATLTVRPYAAGGDAAGAPIVLTKRALSAGGVAIAAAGKPEDGAAIAWVARDRGVAQVHVTRVDRFGHKTNEIQLTGEKGGTSDVAIAWADGAWTVAWVDARDGNGEVYAARLDLRLNRTSHEERITNAPGDAVDVTTLAQGDKVWIAWGDPRESPKEGFADVYVRAVSAADAKPLGDEVRVMGTAAHSRSPALAPADGGLWIGWVEDAPAGLDAPADAAYGAIVARLDATGKPVKDPAHAPMGGEGRAVAIALEPDPSGGGAVRGYVARSARATLVVDAFDATLADGAAFPLIELPGVALDASISVLGDQLFYDDHGAKPGDRRLRRATVAWKR